MKEEDILTEIEKIKKEQLRIAEKLSELETILHEASKIFAGKAESRRAFMPRNLVFRGEEMEAYEPRHTDLEIPLSETIRKTLKAVEELQKKSGETDAESVAKITARSKQRESQYLHELFEKGFLTKKRVGKKVLYYLR